LLQVSEQPQVSGDVDDESTASALPDSSVEKSWYDDVTDGYR